MSDLLTRWHKLSKRTQWLMAIGVLVLAFSGIGALSGGSNDTAPAATAAVATETTEEAVETEQDAEAAVVEEAPAVIEEEAPAVIEEEAPAETVSQENARRSAESYLDFSGFSRQGLIEQLSSEYGEGFSKADATYAVDHVAVNWNAEAAESAKGYLSHSAFSRQGLIEQLESEYGEGFTHAQAVYGVNQTGL
jgi:Host cell surface-exposed lipoprotein